MKTNRNHSRKNENKMEIENLLLCFITAMCFASWPILHKWSGNPNMALGVVIIMAISTMTTFMYNTVTSSQKFEMPVKYIIISVGIGLIHGFGTILFSKLIDNPNTALNVSTISTLMPPIALIAGYIILGKPQIDITKIVGICFVIIGLWFVTSNTNFIKDLFNNVLN